MIAGVQTCRRIVPVPMWNTAPSGCFSKLVTGLGAVHWARAETAKRRARIESRELRAVRCRIMMSDLAAILDHAKAATKRLWKTATAGAKHRSQAVVLFYRKVI